MASVDVFCEILFWN